MNHDSGLRKNTLGVFSLVFFVVAAASPLTGVIGGLPVAMMSGNGAGLPVFYLLSCLILSLFAVGFIAMSRHVNNAGAFYAYIAKGMGDNWGVSASMLALLAYFAVQIAIAAMLGFFTRLFLAAHWQVHIAWWPLSMLFVAIVWILGIRRVEVGGRLLGVLMLAETGIVLLTDIMILVHKTGAVSWRSFEPEVFMQGNLGITFIFTIAAFIGFESTAIYAEECRSPQKTVPRATLIALLLITVFFCFTSWSLIQAYGVDQVVAAASRDPGQFVFTVTRQYVGQWAVETMSVLLLTSLFAALLAFHNTIARYIFSLSRHGVIWQALGRIHSKNGTPCNASHVHSVIILAALVVTGWLGLDPMQHVFALGSAIATLCVLVLQLGVSLSVILFFQRRAKENHRFTVFWAPLLSAISMTATIILVVHNLPSLSGSSSREVTLIPWLITVCGLAGYALSLKRRVKAQA